MNAILHLRRRLVALVLLAVAGPVLAGFLDKEIVFSEGQVQAAVDRKGGLKRDFGGLLSIALPQPPKVTLGVPAGRVSLSGSMDVTLTGQPAIPVDVNSEAGIRYDEKSKSFFLENPQVTSVSSPQLKKNAEPFVREAATQLMGKYFHNRPVYVLRDNGPAEEATARWMLRSVRVEPGRVVAVLSPF